MRTDITPAMASEEERMEKAVEWFLRMRSDEVRAEDLLELQHWMESDPRNALAYREATETWSSLGAHASSAEIIIGRRDALEDSRRVLQRRWTPRLVLRSGWAMAAVLLIAVAAVSWWFVVQGAHVYATARGERRTVTLDDGSVVTLDAQSRVRAQYSDRERLVILEVGQATFAVAKDAVRPFRVRAREQTVVALGTQFDVELMTGAVLVTLIDGQVAVSGVAARSPGQSVELQPGQALRIGGDGKATLAAKVDLHRATAWQSGKLIFDNEPLADAVVRINRYSRRALVVDPAVAQVRVSGVFNAGETDAFVEGITMYLPVRIGSSNETEVHLTAPR